MGAHAYAITNALASLGQAAFTWSAGGSSATTRAYVNDARMDKRLSLTSLTDTVNVIIDFGSATSLMGFAILNHTLATGSSGLGTVLIEGADNSGMSTNLVTAKSSTTLAYSAQGANGSAAREPQNKDHVLQFAAVSKRYWRLTFAYTGMTTLSIGELFAYATSYPLTRRSVYGSGDSNRVFTSELEFGNGETRGVFFGGPVRSKTLHWQDFDDDERDELRSLFHLTRGNASKLLFIDSREAVSTAAAAAEQDVIYGRLSGLTELKFPEMDYGLYDLPEFTVTSLGREVGA